MRVMENRGQLFVVPIWLIWLALASAQPFVAPNPVTSVIAVQDMTAAGAHALNRFTAILA